MSYCRWSSNHGECDVYVYESELGFRLHVAGRRRTKLVPEDIKELFKECHKLDGEEFGKAWVEAYKEELKWSKSLTDDDWEEVPGKYCGESFCFDTPGECAEMLVHLKTTGVRVPQYAIDALNEEQLELDTKPEIE